MFLRIAVKQARHRWAISLLLFLAMTSLVALYVYIRNTSLFSNRSMQLIVKNMGHNMIILPTGANPLDTYLCTDQQMPFSEEATRSLAGNPRLVSKYYVSVLQKRVGIGGHELVLTGIEPVEGPGETAEKANMITAVPAGTARLGSGASRVLGAKAGGEIDVFGSRFTVGETLPPRGTIDDYRVFTALSDCQRLLGAEGRINLILAFLCLHRGGLEESDRYQARELEKALPGFRHITKTDIARGRYMARMTTARYLYYLLAIVLAVTVLIIVITGIQEVSERTREVGILVAMGTGYTYIVGLYMVKMLFLAVAGSVSGFLLGSKLAVWLTSSFLVVETMRVTVLWSHLPHVMLLTSLVALGAEAVPMVKLLRLDPNVILMEE